jgi:hypothetical protein
LFLAEDGGLATPAKAGLRPTAAMAWQPTNPPAFRADHVKGSIGLPLAKLATRAASTDTRLRLKAPPATTALPSARRAGTNTIDGRHDRGRFFRIPTLARFSMSV